MPDLPLGSPTRPPEAASERRIGGVAATAIVVASMVGTGVFTSTGFMVPHLQAGPILGAWLLGGLLALCGAAVYAELGARLPRVGGEYVYLKEAFHPALGFLAGWVSLLVGFSAPIAAAAIAFGEYLWAAAPVLPARGAALALIAAATALHMADVVLGSRVHTALTTLKVLMILVFIAAGLGFGRGDWGNLGSAVEGASGFALHEPFFVALVYVSFSYSGWNAAAYLAGEIRDPGRVLPRALLAGTGIVTVLYVALNAVFLYAAPADALAGRVEVGQIAASHLFGPRAARWLSAGIALALVSSVSAMILAGPRVYTAMAEDGLFFAALAERGRRGAPVWSVLLQGGVAGLFALFVPFEALLQYVGFTLSLFGALTVAGLFVLRARPAERAALAAPAYRTPGWPLTPLLFIALSLWMAFHLVRAEPLPTLVGGGLTVASGAGAYLVWRPSRRSGSARSRR